MSETRTNSTNSTLPIWMLIFNNLKLFSDFVPSWTGSGEYVNPRGSIHLIFTLEIAALKVDGVMRFYDYYIP